MLYHNLAQSGEPAQAMDKQSTTNKQVNKHWEFRDVVFEDVVFDNNSFVTVYNGNTYC